MRDELSLLLLIFIFMAVIILAVVLSYNERTTKEQQNQQITTSIIKSTSCLIAIDLLPDITDLPCCTNVLFPDTRYDATNNVVLSSAPNYFLDACSAFCPDGLVDYSTQLCTNDPTNQQFIACRDRIAPKGCSGLALPVARSDLRYFYVAAATNATCTITYDCTPNR